MLSNNDLLYVAGVVQPADKTKQHQASYDAGFLGSNFSAWQENEQQKLTRLDQLHFIRTKTIAKLGREAAAQSAEDNRLVQGRKSPTHPQQDRLDLLLAQERKLEHGNTELDSPEAVYNQDTLYALAENPKITPRVLSPKEKTKVVEPKLKTSVIRLMEREWSGSFRVLHQTLTPPGDAPDPQSGERYTEKLTQRAVTKIFESGAYVAVREGGFATFLTLTFSNEQRNAIFGGDTTLGKEVSRFLDGIKKMYQRGWLGTDKEGQPFELDGITDPFHYIWVAECPANENGEPNPHVHLLMNWKVEKEHFTAWSERLEGIWGHGFAHLERIREPKAAGSYLIKAVGYAAKGDNANQGLIRGNRYNIARCSRAPGWECVASFEAGNMAAIIKECGYKLEQWKKPLHRSLRRLEKQFDQTIKAKAIAKQAKKPKADLFKLNARLARLETEQKAIRDQMKARGVHASTKNRFCMAFEGEQAENKAYDFLLWAAGARGWSMVPIGESDHLAETATEVRQTARAEYARQYERFLHKRSYWQHVLSDPMTPNTKEPTELQVAAAMAELEQYQQLKIAA